MYSIDYIISQYLEWIEATNVHAERTAMPAPGLHAPACARRMIQYSSS
jgi:hypothetical protein